MKLITDRIRLGTISLEEAGKKAQEATKVRSLDELLTDLKKAQLEPVVKTASVGGSTVKTAEKEEKEEKDEDEVEVVEVKGEPKKEKKKKKEEDDEEDKRASTKPVLKVAKKLDFRHWEAENIVKAWNGYKDIKGCIVSVQGYVNSPKVYCGLLQVASQEASKMIKSAKKAEPKKKESSSNGFMKLAKMNKEQVQLLREYFEPLYGKTYTDSLLGDY